MPNPDSYRTKRGGNKFNPIEYFPSRIGTRKTRAIEANPASGAAGATDLKTGTVAIPLGKTAYERAVRRHEALHVLYSPQSDNPEDYRLLGQAVEDARLYMHENNLGLTPTGSARRDDMTAAITDLKRGSGGDKGLGALLALRSAAILQARSTEDESSHWPKAAKVLAKLCESVGDGFDSVVMDSLADIKAGNITAAKEKLAPYIVESEATRRAAGACMFPGLALLAKKGKAGDEGEESKKLPTMEFKGDKVAGKLSTEASDMLSPEDTKALSSTEDVTMNIIDLYSADNVPTYFGESHKHTQAGSKIDPKKLACTVGPSTPSIFLRSIHRQGGTVIIDASGSMSINAETLLELCTLAPMATVAFYNSLTDANSKKDESIPLVGNLWVFAIKGKRALDLSLVNRADPYQKVVDPKTGKTKYKLKDGHWVCWGHGNLVDFQAMQWALTQPAPRYFLTDCGFTGPHRFIAHSFFRTAVERKKFIQVTSITELRQKLAKGKQ